MPIYEYRCAKCEMEFELMRPFSEAARAALCPKCNSEAQRLVSGFGSKTGSYIQAPAKPFRKQVTENLANKPRQTDLEENMNGEPIAKKKNYPQLLKEYERDLKQREVNGKIKEVTRKTYLNDANRVLECLLAALSEKQIKNIMIGQQYRGYYKKVIKDLKTIMARRTS